MYEGVGARDPSAFVVLVFPLVLPGAVADVGEAFRRGDDERGRFGGCERWPERFLLEPVPVPKRSALSDIESFELDSSRGRSVFSARRLNDAPRLNSDRTFNVIVHCPPFLRIR